MAKAYKLSTWHRGHFCSPTRSVQQTMGRISCTKSIAILLLCCCFCLVVSTAIDIITPTQFIKDPESIVSNGSVFKLGFFSPAGSTDRYVGIWYNEISVPNIIWVANRDKPLMDSSGIVAISEEGNLLVLNGQGEIFWSSSISNTTINASAQLSDSGNLVLQEVISDNGDNGGRIIWESFQHPCDSFMPMMKLSTNAGRGEKQLLTSWNSPSDPSQGSFSLGFDPLDLPEIFIWNGRSLCWRSGPWNGQIFIGIPRMNSVYLGGFNFVVDNEHNSYLTYAYANQSRIVNLFLNSQGSLVYKKWDDGKKSWENERLSHETECDVYGKCGAFGSCNSQDSPICSCLRGFEPKNIEEWSRGNWTSGCVRKTQLQCEEGKKDGFLKLKMMKAPDFAEWSSALEEDKCESQCLKNCFCLAYAYDTGIGCMSWSGSLIDIQVFSFGGADLYLRVADSELDKKPADKKPDTKVIITITVILGAIIIATCTYFLQMWMAKRREKMKQHKEKILFNRGDDNMLGDNMNHAKLQELPLFNFEKLATATNNFHITNKLGQGGFGPVYRGKLLDGQEIATKRLSRASGQGVEEFMNEVVVISKLQHRNLVRLLGCCIEGEEKILIYEYLPNKSLDSFLFDPCKQELLHWRKRFDIIEGIGRGLLYLHKDSRLKIIHRDLKASNILLDEELNPKISDFGMARIVGSNQDQVNTKRVVGTYGYMSPEYAMEGRFSEKSDIFSFGVLLLEIVSGRKNSSFYQDEQSLSLLGFAWKLWNEDNIVALIDPAISDPSFQMEILRSIQVGLLCVQEFAKDRPTVSTVLLMLSSEIANLPVPKQPAFTGGRIASNTKSSQQSQKRCSINNVTVTIIEGR